MSDSQFQPLPNVGDDLVGKIVEANTLESSGAVTEAIALYQEIVRLDPDGNYGNVAREALSNLQQESILIGENNFAADNKPVASSWWSKLNLKTKTSFVIIGVALASSIGISATAYVLVNKTVAEEVNRSKRAESMAITKEIALFMGDRRSDMQALANVGVLADPELRANSTPEQKRRILNGYLKAYGIYNSIAVFDANGDHVINSEGKPAKNHKSKPYFQGAMATGQPYIGQPRFSSSSGIFAVYTAAPIRDTKSGKIIGVVRARMPVDRLQGIIFSEDEYSKTYLVDRQGEVFLASDKKQQQQLLSPENKAAALATFFDFSAKIGQELSKRADENRSSSEELNEAQPGKFVFRGKKESAYLTTFDEINTANFSGGLPDLDWGTIIAVDNQAVFATQRQLLQIFAIGTIIAGLVVTALSRLIADRATVPIIEAVDAVGEIGQGNFDTRVDVRSEDELGSLGVNINKMAGQIQDLLHTQEQEAKNQQEQKETLQRGVMSLLLEVEEAQRGDLTVRAAMSDGPIGSIADAFNTTLKKLQGLLQQVQNVSNDVGELSLAGEGSVKQLSASALAQAAEINQALSSIDQINQSVETVANYAQEAAKIARNGSIQAKEGDLAMDATVNSIEKIRNTVANTSKKVKQLAESSQEIAQIVEIISGISEKTNLLAFNASVEAARAGEHGEGFRIVAEEVRRLADRITGSTKDIQQLVTTIQQDTSSVLQGMETSTAEVVNGSELVHMTKLNLQTLAKTSQEIDEYLKSISTNTIKQTDTSQQVNEKINGIALVAKTNSTEAQSVLKSLQTLVREAETLQSSISQFKLQA